MSGYGNTLSQIGKSDEAQKSLDEALALARELKNQALTAQTLNFQGDRFFYRGDFKNARTLFDQAQQASSRLTDRHIVLLSKLNLAKVNVKEGRSQVAIKSLRELADESTRLGLKYLSVQSSVDPWAGLTGHEELCSGATRATGRAGVEREARAAYASGSEPLLAGIRIPRDRSRSGRVAPPKRRAPDTRGHPQRIEQPGTHDENRSESYSPRTLPADSPAHEKKSRASRPGSVMVS